VRKYTTNHNSILSEIEIVFWRWAFLTAKTVWAFFLAKARTAIKNRRCKTGDGGMSEYILEMNGITKEFPSVKALDNVCLKVKEGEIHALVGENGAGKSTLMKILSGVYPHGAYRGDILFCGKVVKFKDIKQSEQTGIAIIHQELTLIPYLSIAENVFLGNEIADRGVIDQNESIKKAKELMATVGLNDSPDTKIIDIGVGKQQLVEICKALTKKVKLLILDEPTAALNETESNRLLDLLIRFRQQGMTCIMITHKLNEAMKVSDSVTVLRDGKTIETLDVRKDVITEDRIVKSMVGRSMSDRHPKRKHDIGELFFEVRNWTVFHPLHKNRKTSKDIHITVRRGEVVGIAGLMGAGRTEFAMSVFGKAYGREISGEIILNGKRLILNSPSDAIENGIAYVTEDRKQFGLVLINDICWNTSLAALKKFSNRGVMSKYAELSKAEEQRKMLKIKTPNVNQVVGNLSGGNQQKVVLAKCIVTEPELLILDEPTRGIDVGAKYEIYNIINQLTEQGKGIILISSEMEELIGMCDRIYVMSDGEIKGEIDGADVTQEAIMKTILGENPC
jgi:putative multiple sugar transport system ATP-binding protein